METASTFVGLDSSQPKVSILISSRDRVDILTTCLETVLGQNYGAIEVLVLDNNSNQDHLNEFLMKRFRDPRLCCYRTDISLGVAAGRNFLMQQARGDIFCVIDDDAHFVSNDSISAIVETFRRHQKAGIIALKIVDHRNGQERVLAPFSQSWRKRDPQLVQKTQRVSYYLGGGHAVRRDVFEQCGGYQQNLVFGEEELDFSYRAIERGFEIIYFPDVVVHHHPQPSVVHHQKGYRQPELYYHVRNRFFISYQYLPWQYIPVYLSIWLSRYGLNALKLRAFREFIAGTIAGLKMLKNLKRTPLKPQSIQYLKANYGRLWY
jgi:GT2 family glycosyltransferase